jgi:hypothetical protein
VAVFDPAGSASGQGAFAVTRDNEWNTGICAAIWGSGRVVAFPQNGYLNFNDYAETNDTARLYTNCIQWASNSVSNTMPIVTNRDKAATWLTAQGFTNVSLRSDWENGLTGASLLVIELRTISGGEATALRAFIQGGGGLITGGTGWGYKQTGSDLKTLSGNVFLREAGLAWADGFTTMNPIQRATPLGNASAALDFAQDLWAGTTTGSSNQKSEAGAAMITVQDVLPAGDPLQTSLDTTLGIRAGGLSATPATPVSDPLDKVVLTWEAGQLAATDPANVTAHHTAEALYGPIPANPDRSLRTVAINTNQNRWLSTGMYAGPGQLVTMTFPASLVNRGYFVQISGHVDNISPRSSWERIPFGLGRKFPIDASMIEVASAFGGAIYIDVGKTGRPNLGMVDITTTGAIQAPYFVLGKTTNAAWVGGIRDYPGPYAELECSGVILSVPSAWIRHLDDPESLMSFWDEAVARQDWVAAHETLRTNPERINLDVQISVGLLHAGYPQQGPADYNTVSIDGAVQGVIVTLVELRKQGDWGWFHELGHEMQGRPDDSGNYYTFDGDGEVTVNIFANAAQEWGVPAPASSGWGWANFPEEVMQRAITTVSNAGAANFDSKDPYPFYFQLADGFNGWQTYRDVMAIYGANHAADKAANLTNQQKKDLWLRRWSQASGFNMVEYMVSHWKLEVSQSAIDEVNAMTAPGGGLLPGWMPLASSLRKASAISGTPELLDLAAAGMSLDGTAILVNASAPAHGSLTDNGDGTFTYRSLPGFVGVDGFSATYQSSAGNTQAFATEIVVGDGLSSYWPMDESGGTMLHDLGYAAAPGSTRNSPVRVAGRLGNALQFDGVDDHVLFDGNSPALDGTTDFSVSAWVRTTSSSSGMILQQRDGINGQFNFLLNGNGTVRFWIYNSGYQFDFGTSRTVNDGQWHHVMAQREGEQGRIWIDGELAATASGPLKALDKALPVAIGFDLRDNNKFFDGSIDEVRIRNFAGGAVEFLYLDWMDFFYPGETAAAVVGMLADPNQDGLPNVLAFLLGASPLEAKPQFLPGVRHEESHLVFEFRLRDGAGALNPFVEVGSDFSGWTPVSNGWNGVAISIEENGYGFDDRGVGIDRVTARIPHGGANRMFARLHVGGY